VAPRTPLPVFTEPTTHPVTGELYRSVVVDIDTQCGEDLPIHLSLIKFAGVAEYLATRGMPASLIPIASKSSFPHG
jgi:hypothetical protein